VEELRVCMELSAAFELVSERPCCSVVRVLQTRMRAGQQSPGGSVLYLYVRLHIWTLTVARVGKPLIRSQPFPCTAIYSHMSYQSKTE
jgi:hypothetical protein